MEKDLTNSQLDRQNILNNPYAIAEIEKAAGIEGIVFEGRSVLLKEQVAEFFEVTPRTIDTHLELRRNKDETLCGNRLRKNKVLLRDVFGGEMGFVTKTSAGGLFDLKAPFASPGQKSAQLVRGLDVTLRSVACWLGQLKAEGKIRFRGAPKTGG